MLVIPAVDLLEGKAVRLLRGDPSRKTVFSENPVEVARKWWELGATWIHVVDLDGSLKGRPGNRKIVEEITRSVGASIQLGGGIRDLDLASAYISAGVQRIVLGTVAVENPDLVAQACERWPGRVAVALDARGGKVVVRGWKDTTSLDTVELAKRLEGMGVSVFIHTDVERDGTREGINFQELLRVARALEVPVIASGGVGCLDELKRLKELEGEGVEGVIIGRALYDGTIYFLEALEVAGKWRQAGKGR